MTPGGLSYAYFTPSKGSANRSASGGVLGAMARPASANPGLSTALGLVRWLTPVMSAVYHPLQWLVIITKH